MPRRNSNATTPSTPATRAEQSVRDREARIAQAMRDRDDRIAAATGYRLGQ